MTLLLFLSLIPWSACGVIWLEWIGGKDCSILFPSILLGMACGNILSGWRGRNPLRIIAYLLIGFGLSGFLQNGASLLDPFPFIKSLQILLLLLSSLFLGGFMVALSRLLLPHFAGWIYYGLLGLGIGIGSLFTGYLFIPFLGLFVSNGLFSLSGILIGTIALNSSQKGLGESERTSKDEPLLLSTPLLIILMVMMGIATSGILLIFYRIVAFFSGSTLLVQLFLFSFSLFGLSLGSLLSFLLSPRMRDPFRLLGWITWGGILLSLLSIPVASLLHYYLAPPGHQNSFLPVLIILLPTIPLGITLPILSRTSSSKNEIGRKIGFLHTLFLAGGTLGILLTRNLLLPRWGYEKSLLPLFLLLLTTSLLFFSLSLQKSWKRPLLLTPLSLFPLMILLLKEHPFSILNHPEIEGESIFYREGKSQIVEVVEKEGTKNLFQNGQLNTSTSKGGLRLHRLLAFLPLLLHENPEDLLLIPFGTGITAGAIRSSSPEIEIKRVDCLETSMDVIESAREFLLYNRKIFDWSKFHLIKESGMEYLEKTQTSYDIILTGIVHPNGNLYEMEFYSLVKKRLKEDGILCQWVPLDLFREEDLKRILKTCLENFPYTTFWFTQPFGEKGNVNTFLISSLKPLPIRLNQLEGKIRKLKHEFENIGIDTSHDLLDSYIAGKARLKFYVQNSTLLTSDHPDLRYRRIHNESDRILENLNRLREIPQIQWEDREERDRRYQIVSLCIEGDIENLRGNPIGSIFKYRKAEGLLFSLQDPPHWMMETLKREISSLDAFKEKTLEEMKSPSQDTEEHLLLGYLHQMDGERKEAILEYEKALKKNPDHLHARMNLALLYHQESRYEEAVKEFEKVLKVDPTSSDALIGLSSSYDSMGESPLAISTLEKACQLHPQNPNILYNLGEIYRKMREIEKARETWELALKIDPNNAKIHTGLGSLFASEGFFDLAEVEYLLALKTDPLNPEILGNLGTLYAYMGERESATLYLERALEIDPTNQRLISIFEELKESP